MTPDAGPRIRDVARASGHLRLVVRAEDRPLGVVHVRDALTQPETATAVDLSRPVLPLPADTPIYAALSTMREARNHHLALVTTSETGDLVGLVTLLDQLLPVETTG